VPCCLPRSYGIIVLAIPVAPEAGRSPLKGPARATSALMSGTGSRHPTAARLGSRAAFVRHRRTVVGERPNYRSSLSRGTAPFPEALSGDEVSDFGCSRFAGSDHWDRGPYFWCSNCLLQDWCRCSRSCLQDLSCRLSRQHCQRHHLHWHYRHLLHQHQHQHHHLLLHLRPRLAQARQYSATGRIPVREGIVFCLT
jgi:hypothetical protein